MRVLLVEDRATLREAMAAQFERESGFAVVGQEGSLSEAREVLEHVEAVRRRRRQLIASAPRWTIRLGGGTIGERVGRMDFASPAHILVVANKTAATQTLLDALCERVERGPVYFHLLVPHGPGSEAMVERAVPLIEDATHHPATGAVSRREDPMDAIEEALHDGDFDEVILSTLPPRFSRWLHVDLPRRVAHLGLPLTTVVGNERDRLGVA